MSENKITNLKIAFVGADNSKKVELAKAFDQYQCSIGNTFKFLSSDIPHIKRYMGITTENTNETQYVFQWALLCSQISKERAIVNNHDGFISDCCVIDYLAGAIQKIEDKKINSTDMSVYFQTARDHIRKYDVVVYIPFKFDDTRYDNGQLVNWHDNIKRRRLNEIIFGELIKNNVRYITLDGIDIANNVKALRDYIQAVYLKDYTQP